MRVRIVLCMVGSYESYPTRNRMGHISYHMICIVATWIVWVKSCTYGSSESWKVNVNLIVYDWTIESYESYRVRMDK